jgi:MiaB-like tRNA modifying enzyme
MNISITTFGCALNQADSAAMRGLLERDGHKIVNSKEAALCVVNTCTVKGPTEKKIRKEVARLKSEGKKIVLAGCLSQTPHGQSLFSDESIVGTNDLARISEAVDSSSSGQKEVFISEKSDSHRLELPGAYVRGVIGVVPINSGCMSACSFCATKKARGNTMSYSEKDILDHIERMVANGVREIWLTSPDTATYGLDRGENLARLLNKVVALRGGFKVRVGMGNPDHIKKFLPELIEAFNHERVFKFLHLPVQSGSDNVLKQMLRRHSAQDFKDIVERFRKEIPGITIATDIIVGYPIESEDDFEETLRLIEEMRPEVLNMSRFWPRPDTMAANISPLPFDVVKARSVHLRELFMKMALEKNRERIGWMGRAIVDETGQDTSVIARDSFYRPIVLKGQIPIGSEVDVLVEDATWVDLRGRATRL